MTTPASPVEVQRFYGAAALGLGVLEARSAEARRFGPDADARWNTFRGGLSDWHRLDLLVRDAAVRHPAGFAPRVVFDLPALADDEPSGPDWPGPPAADARALLQAAAMGPHDLGTALGAAAAGWGLTPSPLAASATADIKPTTSFLLGGAGAVLSVAAAFVGNRNLDLADQALLLADDPATRQLFGLALAMLDSRRPARLLRTSTTPAEARALGLTPSVRALISSDASSSTRAALLSLVDEMGARP